MLRHATNVGYPRSLRRRMSLWCAGISPKMAIGIVTRVIFILSLIRQCSTYSSGAPEDACKDMIPGHGPDPENSVSPYSMNAVKSIGDSKFQVKISGSGPFVGVFLQARKASNRKVIINGEFEVNNLFQTVNCEGGQKNAVTHTNSDAKDEMTAIWTAPSDLRDDIVFRATVVKDYSTFWTNIDSNVIQLGSDNGSTTSITETTVTTQAPPESKISYKGCNSEFGCFGYPQDCVQAKSCKILAKYRMLEDGIKIKLTGTEQYIAIGFSEDELMGDDAVVACHMTSSPTPAVITGWNAKRPGLRFEASSSSQINSLLSEASASFIDELLDCEFKHVISWNFTNINFDLGKKDYHLLLASGEVTGNVLNKHKDKIASPKVKLSEYSEASNEKLKILYEGCGSSKGCFGVPDKCVEAKDCKAFVSFRSLSNGISFDMIGDSDGYVAIGLSDDQNMGDDSVTACSLVEDKVMVKQAWNSQSPKDCRYLSTPKLGLIDANGSYNNGKVSCSFIREFKSVIESKTFDLENTEYFILLAVGGMKANNDINIHKNKWSSGDKLKLTSVTLLASQSDLMIKIHATLMILAWVGTATIGMIFARYFKESWINKFVTGVKVWFFYHRFFMVSTFLLTVAGFIVIFVHIGDLSQTGDNLHPYLGIAATALCIFQPLIALCRCAPDSKNRPAFNWIHWFVGNAAQILSIVTLFYAVTLSKVNLPKYYDWILVAFVIYHIVFHLILQSILCMEDKKSKKVHDLPMDSYGAPNGTSDANLTMQSKNEKDGSSKKVVLILYIFFNIGFLGALIALVWLN